MNIIRGFVLSVAVVFSQVCLADAASEKEAEALLETMKMDALLDQTVEQMLDIELQQNPGLSPYKNVMLQFFQKHMSYKVLKPELIRIYSNAFTAKELKEIHAFYRTETGQKTVRLMPQLTAEGAQVGAMRIQENIGELQSMIEAEAERLSQQQAQ